MVGSAQAQGLMSCPTQFQQEWGLQEGCAGTGDLGLKGEERRGSAAQAGSGPAEGLSDVPCHQRPAPPCSAAPSRVTSHCSLYPGVASSRSGLWREAKPALRWHSDCQGTKGRRPPFSFWFLLWGAGSHQVLQNGCWPREAGARAFGGPAGPSLRPATVWDAQ